MADFNAGDVVARLRADSSQFAQAMTDAIARLRGVEQQTQQTSQKLSQLPFNAIQNATEAFSRSLQQAGNNQDRYRAAIGQAQEALRQFNVTTNASGEMVDRFGQRLSQGAAEALRRFRTGVQEARAELNELQRFGINAAAGTAGGGGLLQSVLGVAGGIGLATSLAVVARQLKDVVTESVTLAAKMQDLHLAFRAIDGSAAAANKTLTFLFETSNKLGVNFETAADGFKRFDQAAKGTTLEGSAVRTVFENILAGARALGSSQQQVSQAIVALEQILTKGRLSAEEYRKQLGNAIPGALKLMADGFGVTTQAMERMIQSGIIPADAAVVGFAASLGKLGQTAGPDIDRLSTTFARLKNETVAWMTAIGDGLASKLKPFLDTLVTISQTLRELFDIKAPGVTTTPGTFSVLPSQYADLIARQAKEQQVDPGLLSRLIQAESNFNPNAVSKAGARGLGQLMLPTAQGLEMGVTAENLLEPERNIRLAAKYLGEMLEQFRGFPDQVKIALAAYNAGPGNVMAAIKATRLTEGSVTFERVLARLPKPEETGPYVARVLAAPAATSGAAAVPTEGAPGPGGLDVSQTVLATIGKTIQELPKLEKEMEALAQSTLNWGGILGDDIRKEADELVKKFVQTAELLARFPDLLAKMTPEQRAQLDIMTRQVAVFRERVADEAQTETGARKRVQELRAIGVLEEQYKAEQAAADKQYADHTLQNYREVEQELDKNREALEGLARAYGMTKQERDVDTASLLANSLAGTVWAKQADEQLALIKAIAAIEGTLPQRRREAAASAPAGLLAMKQARASGDYTSLLETQLEQLQASPFDRTGTKLRGQARKQGVELSPQHEALIKQIEEQERWNGLMEIAGRIGDSAAQTITTGLLGIIDGTQRVGEAFKQMARSILDSLAQILVSEGLKALFRLGIGAISGGLGAGTGQVGFGAGSGFDAGLRNIQPLATFATGGYVSKPTPILAGEAGGEWILNRQQMAGLMESAIRSGPSAGGQAASGVTIINYTSNNKAQAEQEASSQRAQGRQVILNEVLRDLSQGEGSQISRMLRVGGR